MPLSDIFTVHRLASWLKVIDNINTMVVNCVLVLKTPTEDALFAQCFAKASAGFVRVSPGDRSGK
jgi:hypothetical protein